MNRKIVVLSLIAVFVLAGLSQAGVSKVQPKQAQKAPPAGDFPQWYYDKFGDTMAFYDFEDGLIPAGWEYGDHTSGMHLQITDQGCDDGNCYFWGFILPDGTFGHGNLWEDWLLTPEITIPGGAGSATLTFRHKFNTESETDPIWDGHACWVRVDGTTWEQAHPQDTDAYYDSLTAEELHCWGDSPGWTGERDWTPVTIDLSAYAGHTIEVNFLCVSDQLSSYDDGYEGVWIDNIVVDIDGTPQFEADAEANPDPMIFTGANTGAPWVVTDENSTLKPPPNDYNPGLYSLLGPENGLCLSHYIMTEWFTMPETGYPRSSFYRMIDMPGFDWDDDNLLDDLAYIEMTTDGIVWDILFNTYGQGDNDSTFELIDWNDQQEMKYHAYRGQDIRLRFKVHADHEVSVGPGCERTETPPCAGRGFYIDSFLMYWLGVPQFDGGIAYIDVPYPLAVDATVEVHIGIMNLGSNPIGNAVTFYEILAQDTNFVTERFEVGDRLLGFPAPMLTPQGYPAVGPQDTFDYVYEWTPKDPGGYYWRALFFQPDELPEDDSLTVPTSILVFPTGTGEISYVDRNVTSGSVPGFQAGNGPAIRIDFDDFGVGGGSAKSAAGVALSWIRHDWTGTWSPYEVHIYGPGPNDSTWGEALIEPFIFGDDEPEPVFPADEPIIDLTGLDDYANLQNLTGSVWVHLRALANTNLQIPQRGEPTDEGHDWLYFNGALSRNTQVWDVFVGVDMRGPGCEGTRGDVTGDGNINVLDILAVANHILGINILTGDALCRADCTGDGVVNILDALAVANVILGLLPECPGGGACKPEVTPEVIELMESLRSYLPESAFDEIMALVKGHVGVPVEYSLSQNYPNPFNPVTSIQYDVAGNVQTSLKVYNVLGQEVVTLVDEVKAPGAYTAEWDASDLASGVYFYRLTAGDYTATRRMVLMK